ncbi:MAG: oxidoreductase [Bacteroidales bacterium]
MAAGIRVAWPEAQLRVLEMDLASLNSVRSFAGTVLETEKSLDVLINNAGIMMCPFGRTREGFEIQMGTNHLGHFALTGLLLPLLQATKDARVVVTSSLAHRWGNLNFDDFQWTGRKYNSQKAYGDSKLANLYFAYELHRRLEAARRTSPGSPAGPRVTVAHPGWTATNLQKHSGFMMSMNQVLAQGPDKGVLPTLRAAFDPNAGSGDYFGPAGFLELSGHPVKVRSNPRSHEKEPARRLWELSEELTGVRYP